MSSWAVILGLWISEFVFSTAGRIFHICQGSFWLSLKCKNLSTGKILPCHSILMFHSASDSTTGCVTSHHYFTILTHMNEHQQCIHLTYDCHTYFTTLIKQSELVSRKQAYNMKQQYSKVTHKSLQHKEVYLLLVPYPSKHFKEGLFGLPPPPSWFWDWIWTLALSTPLSGCFKNHIQLLTNTTCYMHIVTSKFCSMVYSTDISGYLKWTSP